MGDYSNFVFYGAWMNTIDGYREDFGDDYANEVLLNIISYGTSGKILSNKKSIIGFIEGSVAPNIDKAKDRYKKACDNGNKGGRPPALSEEDNILIADMRINQKIKQVDIAKHFGVDVKTIRNSPGWQDSALYLEKKQEKPEKTSENTGDKLDKDKDKDNDKDREIDKDTGLLFSRLEEIAQSCNQSVEWVKVGISMKNSEEWQKYGYGLFNKEDFQKEVSIKFNEYLIRQQEIEKNKEIIRHQREDRIVVKVPSFHQENKKKKKEIDFNTLI